MNDYYIGIDPGEKGAVVVLNSEGKLVDCMICPNTQKGMIDFLQKYSFEDAFCIIEKVHGMPGMSGSGMFTFGTNYGSWTMGLLTCNIPFEEHSPQKWMKYYSLKKEQKESKQDWKNRLKDRAHKLFPKEKITLATADAVLIAFYNFKINAK